MEKINLVEVLRKEVNSDKVIRDVFHVMSLRERARNIITVGGLEQRMKKEGFTNYERADYIKVLKFMASLGLGKLETDSKGRVLSLKDIRTTLQSIGEVAMGQSIELRPWKQRNKFIRLIAKPELKAVAPHSPPLPPPPVSLTVVINGKAINVGIPSDMNKNDIADLVVRLRN